jgi:hypothetical protein
MAAIMTQGLCLGLVAASFVSVPAVAQERVLPSPEGEPGAVLPQVRPFTALHPKRARFQGLLPSDGVRQTADWVVDSADNRNLPFLIVDKTDAKVFAFDVRGQLLGAAPALVGLAHGDDTVPGIGTRPLSQIRTEERTTPAGRFVASLGSDLGKLDVLWVDYDAAISLHRVVKGTVKEHRAERLATETPLDNRISFGCINVPAEFFDRIVHPAFTGTNGIVYILPEIKTMREVFPAYYDVEE